jgi:hypothetical protein
VREKGGTDAKTNIKDHVSPLSLSLSLSVCICVYATYMLSAHMRLLRFFLQVKQTHILHIYTHMINIYIQ